MPKPTTLADRMKKHEVEFDHDLPSNTPIILRLDGHGFSRFTKSFNKPFDQRIHNAMMAASEDLLKYFPQATIAYTQSDEITLVFPNGVQSFNNRIQKLASLAASYCSVRFGASLRAILGKANVDSGLEEKIDSAHFDARLFTVPSPEEALNCLLWRCRGDAMRNSVNAFARTMFSNPEMHAKTAKQLVLMMEQQGVKYEDAVPKWAVEGCLIKREQYQHKGTNGKTGEKETVLRTRLRAEERGIREFSDENLRLVVERFW
ncbi:Thg1-domain-containing protein, partial [Polyplosphaeria fusca]